MAADQRIVTLAVEAQRKHQALMNQAGATTSRERRREIINELDEVRRTFRNTALVYLSLNFPYEMQDVNSADENLVRRVEADIYDTQELIRNNLDAQQLSKTVESLNVSILGTDARNQKLGLGLNLNIPWYLWAAAALAVALAFARR